tara:strand:+ start:1808 stop:2284 length:477 start_codon:yes stop_codon:yes gene_type:complete
MSEKIKISKNFNLKELTASSTADRLDIDNGPSTEHLINLTVVTHKILQPVREQFGVVTVNSGYRSPALNKAVGGSSRSQHCNGEAVDLECFSVSNPDLAKWITKNLDWDQIILEFYKKGDPHSGWVHCSYKRDGTNRRKILTALRINKRTVYKPGFAI